MQSLRNHRGFTLAELVTVLAIILLLCFAAIPQFFALRNKSLESKMQKTIGTVQAGIAAWHYRKLVDNIDAYPPTLDENPVNNVCKECFKEILDKPLANHLWLKTGPAEYYFSRNGNTKKAEDYQEKGDFKITYDSSSGLFTASRIQ